MLVVSGRVISDLRLSGECISLELLQHRSSADGGSNEMLKLAAEKGIHPIIDQVLPMKEAGKAVEAVKTNKVRYRFVLKQDLA